MDKKITTRAEYDALKAKVEILIAEATAKGMLEPDMDNEYTAKICQLGKLMAAYEDVVQYRTWYDFGKCINKDS